MSDQLSAVTQPVRWRLERWPTDRSVDHLIFTNMLAVPTCRHFRDAVSRSAARGARAVRTSALFPRDQTTADEAGFSPIDHLYLLKLELEPSPPDGDVAHLSARVSSTGNEENGGEENGGRAHERRVGPMRPWHFSSASRVDRDSFGLMWGNSTTSLQAILRATERSRARICRQPTTPRSKVDGFMISGTTDQVGYVQRLAVRPKARRQGVAKQLLADGLEWMRSQRVATAFVNTSVDNEAALKLYTSMGFVHTGETLTIHELVHP